MKKKIIIFALAMVAVGIALYLFLPSGGRIVTEKPSGENIVCFGDSLTYGAGASPGMDYPSQLSGLIGMPVINAGIPGDTTGNARKRLDRDVLSKSPRIVLVVLGLNDLGNGIPQEKTFSNLKDIVERIQAEGAMVVVGGISIPRYGMGQSESYKQLCEQTGALLIPDILDGILGQENLMSDELHPNDKGYQIIAERFYGAIKGYLESFDEA